MDGSLGLEVLATVLVSGEGIGVVFEKGRGLAARLPIRRFGDAGDGDDGDGSSLTKTVDPRRGIRSGVAGVELAGDGAGVAKLAPGWINQNLMTNTFVINSARRLNFSAELMSVTCGRTFSK
jgi:hypothetical protein